MTNEERAECVKLYLEGATLYGLADKYDRDVATIHRLIQRRKAWKTK